MMALHRVILRFWTENTAPAVMPVLGVQYNGNVGGSTVCHGANQQTRVVSDGVPLYSLLDTSGDSFGSDSNEGLVQTETTMPPSVPEALATADVPCSSSTVEAPGSSRTTATADVHYSPAAQTLTGPVYIVDVESTEIFPSESIQDCPDWMFEAPSVDSTHGSSPSQADTLWWDDLDEPLVSTKDFLLNVWEVNFGISY